MFKDFALQIANFKVCGLNANDAAVKWERENNPEYGKSYPVHTNFEKLQCIKDDEPGIVVYRKLQRKRVFK